MLELDTALFRFFNQTVAAAWLDGPMLFLSSRLVWGLVGATFVVGALYRRHRPALALAVYLALVIGATDAVTYQVLKPAFARSRPCYLDPEQTRLVVDSCGSDYGFPSNHAANAMAAGVAGALTWRRRRLNLFLFTLVGLVGISRIYLGVHFPGDVLGGFAVGALISLSLWPLWQRLLRRYFPQGLATNRP